MLATLASSCGRSSGALGGGARVDVCGAYEAYDALPEPDPRDVAAVQRWASGFLRVVARTETDRQVVEKRGHRHRDVPAVVAGAFPQLRDSVKRYQASVQAATSHGPNAVVAVADGLALDAEFTRADASVRDFHDKTCR
jgi:hypothetical protein